MKRCQMQLGMEPENLHATCEFAQNKETAHEHTAYAWGSLKWVIDQAVDHCEKVPYECVALLTHCLDATSVRFCFDQCLRTGYMGLGNKEPQTYPDFPRGFLQGAQKLQTEWLLP